MDVVKILSIKIVYNGEPAEVSLSSPVKVYCVPSVIKANYS